MNTMNSDQPVTSAIPSTAKKKPKFSPGQTYLTPGAIDTLVRYKTDAFELLDRHVCGDWGIVCKEDAQANEEALRYGYRLLSAYELPATAMGVSNSNDAQRSAKIWLITEADRSVTTLLLPEEY